MNCAEKQRFLALMNICEHGPDCIRCCWEWIGSKSGGYAKFTLRKSQKSAAKLSYQLRYGGKWGTFKAASGTDQTYHACHHCDNPICVNPAHIFKGTPRQNSLDRIRKEMMKPRREEQTAIVKTIIQKLDLKEFGIRILLERKRWGLTQTDLAAKIGVDTRTLSRVETGNSRLRADHIYKLAREFECSADYLLGLSGNRRCVP